MEGRECSQASVYAREEWEVIANKWYSAIEGHIHDELSSDGTPDRADRLINDYILMLEEMNKFLSNHLHDTGTWDIIKEGEEARRIQCSCCGTTLIISKNVPFSDWCSTRPYCCKCGAALRPGSNDR